jgi:hypothetical protein
MTRMAVKWNEIIEAVVLLAVFFEDTLNGGGSIWSCTGDSSDILVNRARKSEFDSLCGQLL